MTASSSGGSADADWLTVTEVTATLQVPRATFYRWRQLGVAPPAVRLPNGQLRIHRADLAAWLDRHRDPGSGAARHDIAGATGADLGRAA